MSGPAAHEVIVIDDDSPPPSQRPSSARKRPRRAARHAGPATHNDVVWLVSSDEEEGDAAAPRRGTPDGAGGAQQAPPHARESRGGGRARSITCAICLDDDVAGGDAHSLFCGHSFCRSCLATHISTQLASGLPDAGTVRCPDTSCRAPLSGGDIDACVDAKTAASFHARALSKLVERSTADGLSCCPSPGCTFIFAWDAANRKLVCPLCTKQYCLVCKTDWHRGIKCEANPATAEDGGIFQLAAKGQWKTCPSCKTWTSRESGCDAMRCVCGQQFCYKCGNKTGGGGNGLLDCTCTDPTTRSVHAHHANDAAKLAAAAAARAAALAARQAAAKAQAAQRADAARAAKKAHRR